VAITLHDGRSPVLGLAKLSSLGLGSLLPAAAHALIDACRNVILFSLTSHGFNG
jgi:hypothetical protein